MSTVHVVYENGVFRPIESVVLPEGTKGEVLLADAPAANAEQGPTLAGLLKFSGTVNDLPADMAEQHDHYLYSLRFAGSRGAE